MADQDPLQGLQQLADAAEHRARPMPVANVRRLGSRRRRRRHATFAGVAVVAALAVAGGVTLGSGVGRTLDGPPPIARSGELTAVPSPARTLTETNLIVPADLPAPEGEGTIEEFAQNARPVDQVSVCVPDGLTDLGATDLRYRSFRVRYVYERGQQPDPEAPLVNEPTDYAVALQFADAAAAEQAMRTYQGWVEDCRAGRGPGRDLETLQLGFDWTRVPAAGGRAEVAEVVYREPGSTSDEAYWESSGLTLVGDRLMVTVHLHYANESHFTLDPNDDEGGFPHPQLGLVAAAAKRLAR